MRVSSILFEMAVVTSSYPFNRSAPHLPIHSRQRTAIVNGRGLIWLVGYGDELQRGRAAK